MQIVPVIPGTAPASGAASGPGNGARPGADRAAASTLRTAPATELVPAAALHASNRTGRAGTATANADGDTVLRPDARSLAGDANRQVSGAQQALSYLGQVATQLQGLKTAISTRLAEPQDVQGASDSTASDTPASDALTRRLQQFDALLQQRPATSGLNGQLTYSPDGASRQRFKVRGLDAKTLGSGERETLSFATGHSRARIVSLTLEAGQGTATNVRRLDQTLAPADIRIAQDANGEVTLSTPEAQWPSVRDALAVKGGGIRYASSQFHRVKTEAEPDAIRPQDWQTGDTTALRQTLQQVLQALDKVRQAQGTVEHALAEAGQRLEAHAPADAAEGNWAVSFTESFDALAQQRDYPMLSAVAPSLLGVSRYRVLALLARE